MDDKPKPEPRYTASAKLLARKGNAEPLLRNAARLELVEGPGIDRPDGSQLADAVVQATVERLADSPRSESRKPATPLTALLDPALVGAVSPHSGQLARSAERRPIAPSRRSRDDR